MAFNPLKQHRRSIRLPGYDYSQPGAYFITICIRNRECLLVEIIKGTMQLNDFGEIVKEKWLRLAEQYPYVDLDEFVVMPNHFHGIIWIRNAMGADICRGGSRSAPAGVMKIKPIGQLIGAFKTVSAKHMNLIRTTPGISIWQRDFYDSIDSDEKGLFRIRQYIRNNPLAWDKDDENPVLKSPLYVAMPNPQKQNI